MVNIPDIARNSRHTIFQSFEQTSILQFTENYEIAFLSTIIEAAFETTFNFACHIGWLARKLYERMRKEAALIRIQKHTRGHTAKRCYTKLQESAIVIQTGLQAMAAKNEYRQRKRNKAATIIQVANWHFRNPILLQNEWKDLIWYTPWKLFMKPDMRSNLYHDN